MFALLARGGLCGGVKGVCDTRHKRTASFQPKKCAAVGAYGIRPELRGFAMSRRRFAARLKRLCTGRMPYAPTYIPRATNKQHTPFVLFRKAPKRLLSRTHRKLHLMWENVAYILRVPYAPTYIPYAINNHIHRLYDYAKTKIVRFSRMPRKLHRT